jgi:hypothetical protein
MAAVAVAWLSLEDRPGAFLGIAAVCMGTDVDQPCNLAKSVTVE